MPVLQAVLRVPASGFCPENDSDWSRLAAGGCGNSGRLDKEQQQLLKRYQTKLKIFGHRERTAEVLQSVQISL